MSLSMCQKGMLVALYMVSHFAENLVAGERFKCLWQFLVLYEKHAPSLTSVTTCPQLHPSVSGSCLLCSLLSCFLSSSSHFSTEQNTPSSWPLLTCSSWIYFSTASGFTCSEHTSVCYPPNKITFRGCSLSPDNSPC